MKKTHVLITFLIGIMNLTYAQTNNEFWAEEFIAEVYYGDMTEKSPKVYLEKRTSFPFIFSTSFLRDGVLFSSFKVPNSDNDDDVFEIITETQEWNENAPVFQQSKYKNLIFVDDISKLPKSKRKRAEHRKFGKPTFTKNGQYALIEREDYSLYKKSWKYRFSRFPHKEFWKGGYDYRLSIYHELYQRIDGKWRCIDFWYIGGGHS
jgi:hypothetical protein